MRCDLPGPDRVFPYKYLNPDSYSANLYFRDLLKTGIKLKWKPLHQEEDEEEPSPDLTVLRRLQGELDFAVVDGVTSDAELIDEEFGAAGLGAGCMAQEDGDL